MNIDKYDIKHHSKSYFNSLNSILNSINFAQKAAALSTTKIGASQSFPFLNEIKSSNYKWSLIALIAASAHCSS